MITFPTLSFVLTAAILGAFNPSAIGVAVLFVTKLLGHGITPRRLAIVGASYVLGLWLTYITAGLFIFGLLVLLPLAWAQFVAIAVALFVLVVAIIEIKDYFWYGRGWSLRIPERFANTLHDWPTQNIRLPSAFMAGAYAAVAELLCTAAPYLVIISLLRAQPNLTSVGLIALYGVMFILPVVVLIAIVVGGIRISNIHRAKEENEPLLRLSIGLLLVALCWATLLIANGVITLG